MKFGGSSVALFLAKGCHSLWVAPDAVFKWLPSEQVYTSCERVFNNVAFKLENLQGSVNEDAENTIALGCVSVISGLDAEMLAKRPGALELLDECYELSGEATAAVQAVQKSGSLPGRMQQARVDVCGQFTLRSQQQRNEPLTKFVPAREDAGSRQEFCDAFMSTDRGVRKECDVEITPFVWLPPESMFSVCRRIIDGVAKILDADGSNARAARECSADIGNLNAKQLESRPQGVSVAVECNEVVSLVSERLGQGPFAPDLCGDLTRREASGKGRPLSKYLPGVDSDEERKEFCGLFEDINAEVKDICRREEEAEQEVVKSLSREPVKDGAMWYDLDPRKDYGALFRWGRKGF